MEWNETRTSRLVFGAISSASSTSSSPNHPTGPPPRKKDTQLSLEPINVFDEFDRAAAVTTFRHGHKSAFDTNLAAACIWQNDAKRQQLFASGRPNFPFRTFAYSDAHFISPCPHYKYINNNNKYTKSISFFLSLFFAVSSSSSSHFISFLNIYFIFHIHRSFSSHFALIGLSHYNKGKYCSTAGIFHIFLSTE